MKKKRFDLKEEVATRKEVDLLGMRSPEEKKNEEKPAWVEVKKEEGEEEEKEPEAAEHQRKMKEETGQMRKKGPRKKKEAPDRLKQSRDEERRLKVKGGGHEKTDTERVGVKKQKANEKKRMKVGMSLFLHSFLERQDPHEYPHAD